MNATLDDELITVTEAARLLGFRTLSGVTNLIQRGTLSAVPRKHYFGEGQSSRLVRRIDVERLREQREEQLRRRLAALEAQEAPVRQQRPPGWKSKPIPRRPLQSVERVARREAALEDTP